MADVWADITPEQIQKHYDAAMDSVALIDAVLANPDDYSNDETVLSRNVKHLEIVSGWPFWTDDHDLSPFADAISAGSID